MKFRGASRLLMEGAGGMGDLGTLLPLAFALVVSNGFPPGRLFLLWGLVYVVTGRYFRVPVSVQPLKAMAVLALAAGFSVQELATTAFFYGGLFVLLAVTGIIDRLHRWFSAAMVRGVQVGIGLILARKAYQLALGEGPVLGTPPMAPAVTFVLLGFVGLLLWAGYRRLRVPVLLPLIPLGVGLGWALGLHPVLPEDAAPLVALQLPEGHFFLSALTLLMLPQLPLTLGNAVFGAADACHTFWPERAQRVTPRRLAFSIGWSNLAIGLLGGFPICHGAGGMGAHYQFGARTGWATVFMGTLLVVLALVPGAARLLFYIPVPLLAAMLLFDSFRMMGLVRRLTWRTEMAVALVIALVSFWTHHLLLALLLGYALEQGLSYMRRRNLLPAFLRARGFPALRER